MELVTDRTPLLVGIFPLSTILKLKLSVSMFHCIPRACSTGSPSRSRSKTEGARRFSGMAAKTFLSLLTHFVRLKPPLDNRSFSCPARLVAFSVVVTDLRQSST